MENDMSYTTTNRIIIDVETRPQERPRQNRLRAKWLVITVIPGLLVGGVLFFGIFSRRKADASLRAVNAEMAVTSVSVVQPKRAAPAQEIILPGSIQPFISSPIYARTDGYLKKWYFDIGSHVKAGQLLATIQAPEVDEQLAQARSTLATASQP